MFITKREKSIIKKYFLNPELYIPEEFKKYLPEDQYPDGSKITRGKLNQITDKFGRNLIIPVKGSEDIVIPLISHIHNDSMEHSATLINSKLFFHQNANESKELDEKKESVVYDISAFLNVVAEQKSDSEIAISTEVQNSTDNSAENLREFLIQRGLLKSKNVKPINLSIKNPLKEANYYKYQLLRNPLLVLSKTVVKTVVDNETNRYCLISKAANQGKFLPDYKQLSEVRRKVGFFVSIPGTFRNGALYKAIDIVPYKGKTLLEYINNSNTDISFLAEKLIQAFFEQIAAKNIVHTDINPNNICIDEEDVVTYIDFEKAFIFGKQHSKGLGTPGYMAIEFFNRAEDFYRQIEIRDQGEQAWHKALKPDYRSIFCPATDIFALGKILLQDLALEDTHPYYDLAMQMTSIDIEERPKSWKLFRVLDQANLALTNPRFA